MECQPNPLSSYGALVHIEVVSPSGTLNPVSNNNYLTPIKIPHNIFEDFPLKRKG